MLEEINSKVETFTGILSSCEEIGISHLCEAQNIFADTYNIEALVSLLEALEKRFQSHEFIEARDRTLVDNLYKFDYKVKQLLTPLSKDDPLASLYITVAKNIYQALFRLCLKNSKSSTIILSFSKVFSGEIYQFNKEIRKLLGEAIPWAIPSASTNSDPVINVFM